MTTFLAPKTLRCEKFGTGPSRLSLSLSLRSDPPVEDYTKDNPCECLSVPPSVRLPASPSLSFILSSFPSSAPGLMHQAATSSRLEPWRVCAYARALKRPRKCAITPVTVSLRSAHKCCCRHRQNYMSLEYSESFYFHPPCCYN